MTTNDTEKLLTFYRLRSHSLQSELDTEQDRVNFWRVKAIRQRILAIRAEAAAAVGWTLVVVLAAMLVGRW